MEYSGNRLKLVARGWNMNNKNLFEKLEGKDCMQMDRRTFLKTIGILGGSAFFGLFNADVANALELSTATESNEKMIFVLSSVCGQGKTTTAIILERYLRSKGLKVACLQSIKGKYDVRNYLSNDCYHYSLPIEAAKNKGTLEKWIPCGYDAYILELSFPYAPIGAAFIDNFKNINEIISHEVVDRWQEYVSEIDTNSQLFWEMNRNRNVQQVISKASLDLNNELFTRYLEKRTKYLESSGKKTVRHPSNEEYVHYLNRPSHDIGMKLDKTDSKNNLENNSSVNRTFSTVDELSNMNFVDFKQLTYDLISPKMKLPRSRKKVIAVGDFPGEYWDVFPSLKWYDYATFMKRFENENYELAILGLSDEEGIKMRFMPKKSQVVCYQPSLYIETTKEDIFSNEIKTDLLNCYSKIKTEDVGTPFGDSGCTYEAYNNKYWVNNKFNINQPDPDLGVVFQQDNITYCNGWVLPQYLIDEGYLEV